LGETVNAIRDLSGLYFKVKRHVFDAEKYTLKASPRIHVAFRDALDDLMTYVTSGSEKPSEIRRHLWRAAYAAWTDASALQIAKLEKRLSSFTVSGPTDEANRLLDLARKEMADARDYFSSDPEKAVESVKNSAIDATNALSMLQESSRFFKISVFLTAIGILLALISLLISLTKLSK